VHAAWRRYRGATNLYRKKLEDHATDDRFYATLMDLELEDLRSFMRLGAETK
jgi:hypothetical protein